MGIKTTQNWASFTAFAGWVPNPISRVIRGGHNSRRVPGSQKIAGAPVQTDMAVSITLDAWIAHALPVFFFFLQKYTKVCHFSLISCIMYIPHVLAPNYNPGVRSTF